MPVFINEHARVDAVDSFNGSGLRGERAVRLVGYGNSDAETAFAFAFRGRWEVEIIFPILVYTFGGPHGIGVRSYPRYIFLA